MWGAKKKKKLNPKQIWNVCKSRKYAYKSFVHCRKDNEDLTLLDDGDMNLKEGLDKISYK